jgi:hypothetical protein
MNLPPLVFRRLPDGWTIVLDGEREVMRFQAPEGLTLADVDRIRDHLMKLAREREHGPS